MRWYTYLFVNLSDPTNCTIADGQGVGTSVNDDVTSVRFGTSEMPVGEAEGSVQATVTRVGDPSVPFSVFYATSNSNASGRLDFTAAVCTLRFEPGETSKTITVLIKDDRAVSQAPARYSALPFKNPMPVPVITNLVGHCPFL